MSDRPLPKDMRGLLGTDETGSIIRETDKAHGSPRHLDAYLGRGDRLLEKYHETRPDQMTPWINPFRP